MVITLIVLVLLLLALVGVLLFTPLVFIISSVKDIYRVEWGPAYAQIRFNGEHARFKLHAPFWTREGRLHGSIQRRAAGAATGKASGSREGSTPARRTRRPSPLALLRTFRVRRFHWSCDTDDVLWNAWLFPLFQVWRARGYDLAISFTGRNELELIMDNNLYRILKAVLLPSSTSETRKR